MANDSTFVQPAASWSTSLRRRRTVQALGGLALAVSCLFPAIDGCSSPYVPAKEILEEIARTPTSFEDWLFIGWIAFPYIVGFAVCGIVIRWRSRPQQPIQRMGGTVVWLQIAWTIMVITGITLALLDDSWRMSEDPSFTIHAVVAVCSIVYVLAAHRNPLAGRLCVRWFAGVCCLLWFAGWFVEETASGSSTYYGLWLSMAGSMLIVAGAFQEAKLVSFTTPMETLMGLLTCRLRVVDSEKPRCVVCGYLLRGLPTNRCPECGTFFEPSPGVRSRNAVPMQATRPGNRAALISTATVREWAISDERKEHDGESTEDIHREPGDVTE